MHRNEEPIKHNEMELIYFNDKNVTRSPIIGLNVATRKMHYKKHPLKLTLFWYDIYTDICKDMCHTLVMNM